MTPSQMYAEAEKHERRYLLRQRYRRGDPEKDALYDAAQWLVDHGYAHWIGSFNSLAPGIELTSKPYDVAGQGGLDP